MASKIELERKLKAMRSIHEEDIKLMDEMRKDLRHKDRIIERYRTELKNFNQILNMKTEIEIYNKMKRKDFGESMCDETKLKVLNWVLEQVYEKRCKCYRLKGSNKEYQTNLCPIHKSE